jgi:hypothetical protein
VQLSIDGMLDEMDLLNIRLSGTDSDEAQALRSVIGILSGPVALLASRLAIIF